MMKGDRRPDFFPVPLVASFPLCVELIRVWLHSSARILS